MRDVARDDQREVALAGRPLQGFHGVEVRRVVTCRSERPKSRTTGGSLLVESALAVHSAAAWTISICLARTRCKAARAAHCAAGWQSYSKERIWPECFVFGRKGSNAEHARNRRVLSAQMQA